MSPQADVADAKRLVAPSFAGRRAASSMTSRVKARIRKKDTKPERLLRRALWHAGLRYRLHSKELPGRPDIVFRGERLAVFVDGDFWHGRDWEERRERLANGTNADYWLAKIRYNRERDRRNDIELGQLGWRVLRIWESEIRGDLGVCVERVRRVLRESR